MADDRDTVSPATPGRPEERATPVVLSGGAVWVGVCAGTDRLVSYERSSPVALHAPMVQSEQAATVIAMVLFIWTT